MRISKKTDQELISAALVIGSALILVCSLVSLSLYYGVHPILAAAVAICLLIVIFCLFGCRSELQHAAEEEYSPEILNGYQEVQEQIAILSTLLLSASDKILYWQRECSRNLSLLNTEGIRALNASQRILDAMNSRRQSLLEALEEQSSESIQAAIQLASDTLTFSNTSFDSVSGVALPDLKILALESALNDLFETIESSKTERRA